MYAYCFRVKLPFIETFIVEHSDCFERATLDLLERYHCLDTVTLIDSTDPDAYEYCAVNHVEARK